MPERISQPIRSLGVLTGGGDVPGLNGAIKALVYRASTISLPDRKSVREKGEDQDKAMEKRNPSLERRKGKQLVSRGASIADCCLSPKFARLMISLIHRCPNRKRLLS